MKRTQVIYYYYRGPIERGTGKGYDWRDGYSENSEDGNPLYGWMTKHECQDDARKRGCRALFVRGDRTP